MLVGVKFILERSGGGSIYTIKCYNNCNIIHSVDSNVANGRCKSREGLEIISQNSSLCKHVYSNLVSLNMCLIQQDRTLHRLTPT